VRGGGGLQPEAATRPPDGTIDLSIERRARKVATFIVYYSCGLITLYTLQILEAVGTTKKIGNSKYSTETSNNFRVSCSSISKLKFLPASQITGVQSYQSTDVHNLFSTITLPFWSVTKCFVGNWVCRSARGMNTHLKFARPWAAETTRIQPQGWHAGW